MAETHLAYSAKRPDYLSDLVRNRLRFDGEDNTGILIIISTAYGKEPIQEQYPVFDTQPLIFGRYASDNLPVVLLYPVQYQIFLLDIGNVFNLYILI